MKQNEELWDLEKQFWLGGEDFYERRLTSEACMVFPQPPGILDRASTIESISSGTRWQSISFSGRRYLMPASHTAILLYVAKAHRGEPHSEYIAQCSSTYVYTDNGWQLALHHQTPMQQ